MDLGPRILFEVAALLGAVKPGTAFAPVFVVRRHLVPKWNRVKAGRDETLGITALKHRNSHFAVGYWSRLRQGRLTPDQADIDPRALKRLLPNVFLLEARHDGAFIYRLAGTALCDRYGSELRGSDFLTHWDDESRSSLNKIMNDALRAKKPLCLTSIGATEDCRMVEIETVLMPVTYGSEKPKRFLAVAQVLTDVAPVSGRAITFERLVSSALVSDDTGETIANDHSGNFPPPATPIRVHPKAPHLRLVVSQELPAANAAPRRERRPDPLQCVAAEAVHQLFSLVGLSRLKALSKDEMRSA